MTHELRSSEPSKLGNLLKHTHCHAPLASGCNETAETDFWYGPASASLVKSESFFEPWPRVRRAVSDLPRYSPLPVCKCKVGTPQHRPRHRRPTQVSTSRDRRTRFCGPHAAHSIEHIYWAVYPRRPPTFQHPKHSSVPPQTGIQLTHSKAKSQAAFGRRCQYFLGIVVNRGPTHPISKHRHNQPRQHGHEHARYGHAHGPGLGSLDFRRRQHGRHGRNDGEAWKLQD